MMVCGRRGYCERVALRGNCGGRQNSEIFASVNWLGEFRTLKLKSCCFGQMFGQLRHRSKIYRLLLMIGKLIVISSIMNAVYVSKSVVNQGRRNS